jgi:hypothetical protein
VASKAHESVRTAYVTSLAVAQATERGSRAPALTTSATLGSAGAAKKANSATYYRRTLLAVLIPKLGRVGLAGLAARAAKKATSVPKTATRSTGPLASRRPRSTTHQGRDTTYTYTYRLHLALSDMLGVGRVLTNEVCR